MTWVVAPLSGRLERRNASPAEAQDTLVWGEPGALDVEKASVSHYLEKAIQGATLAPRPFWFVEPASAARGSRVRVRTDAQQRDRAKPPWKGIEFEGAIESEYLFGTILEVFPFLPGPVKVCALPIAVQRGKVELLEPRQILRQGGAGFYEWLEAGGLVWKRLRKESDAASVELHEYLDNHGNLTRQRIPGSVKLMYGGKGTNVRAAVVDTAAILQSADDPHVSGFVFDMNMYYVTVATPREAHYLAAVLNTPYVNDGIKATQTQGA